MSDNIPPQNENFEYIYALKISSDDKKSSKLPSMRRVNKINWIYNLWYQRLIGFHWWVIKFSGHVIDETRIGDNDITLTRIRYNNINSLPIWSSADNLCKQFGSRSGPTKRWSWSGSKVFDSLNGIPESFFFQNLLLKNINRWQKACKVSQ